MGTPVYPGNVQSVVNPYANPMQPAAGAPVCPNATQPAINTMVAAVPVAADASAQAPAGPNYCDNCGNPLAPGAKFCSKCGTSVPQ